MKNKVIGSILLVLLSVAPISAFAGFIGFEGLAGGAVVTNQFAGVTFSANPGQDNLVAALAGIGFGNNFICTGSGIINCTQETILTFGGLADNLSFWQVGDNTIGVVAKVDVFVSGVFSTTVDILGFDDFNTPNLVDLTAFSNVSSIRIHSITDPGGLGWDNFDFNSGASVPEPSMLILLALGLLGLGLKQRKLAS